MILTGAADGRLRRKRRLVARKADVPETISQACPKMPHLSDITDGDKIDANVIRSGHFVLNKPRVSGSTSHPTKAQLCR
jgi:hypothetical protein